LEIVETAPHGGDDEASEPPEAAGARQFCCTSIGVADIFARIRLANLRAKINRKAPEASR
jgi:hypothetical protein